MENTILPKGKHQPIQNQPNLIQIYKNLSQANTNGMRDDKFIEHYYKNINNNKWELTQ